MFCCPPKLSPLKLMLWLLCASVLLPSSAVAQDGPLRQRLKERLQQRQTERVPAPPNTTSITQPGDYRLSLVHQGLSRSYLVHVPQRGLAGQPVPLLVAMHGGGGNMEFQADDSRYGLISASERDGFVVAFPNGYSRFAGGKLATWNAGNCCGAARDGQVDDVGFIRQMVSQISAQLPIDPRLVYATGMSNGAMMAYRLACEAPDVFSAIAAVAGTDNTRLCQPGKPVSVLHVHAKNDDHVLFHGGAGPAAVNRSAEADYSSAPNTMAKWTQLNGCSPVPKRVLDQAGALCESYAPCQGGAQVQLCVTDTGGHAWPGGHKTRGDEQPSQAISANAVMWDFFSRLPR
ncbi:PHB depolymerase family esterase [Rhodoferax sp. BLA1]|uniref:extracellular catalytic domain type 1 short-chain-length polyhydroxyalkanoate depolymerase n=1 Tax=Rhodoferax sp. BLA1 TaxID=2576062 RepID=UPI001C550E75|nr:PHB depolymerase family esterase [Rhodoferax sp. BLA1]